MRRGCLCSSCPQRGKRPRDLQKGTFSTSRLPPPTAVPEHSAWGCGRQQRCSRGSAFSKRTPFWEVHPRSMGGCSRDPAMSCPCGTGDTCSIGLEMGFPYPTPLLPVLLSWGIHHDHPPQHFLVMHLWGHTKAEHCWVGCAPQFSDLW